MSDRWPNVKLGEVLLGIDAGRSPQCRNDGPDRDTWGVLKVTAVRANKFDADEAKTLPESFENPERFQIFEGDFLVTRAGGNMKYVGVACVVDCDPGLRMLCDKTLRFRFDEERVDLSYAANALSSSLFRKGIEAAATGSAGQLNISQKQFREMLMPLPPIEEQRRIAATIESCDTALDATREELQKLNHVRRGSLDHFFEDSKGWERRAIGSIAKTSSGSTPKAGAAKYWENGTIPYAKIADLSDGPLTAVAASVTDLAVQDYRLKLLSPRTVLLAMYGVSIGKLGIVELPVATNQAILALVPDLKVVIPEFLFYSLLARRDELVRSGFGAAQKNISGQFVRGLEMGVPSLEEQTQVVAVLDACSDAIRKAEMALEALLVVRDALVATLLTQPLASDASDGTLAVAA